MRTIFGMTILGDDEPREYCEKCGGSKFYETMFPVAEGVRELVTFKTICECEREALEQADRIAEKRIWDHKIRLLRMEGIQDPEYRDATFEKDDTPDSRASKIARKYVEHWPRMYDENHGVILAGDVGTGKSFLACCIANALIDQGEQVYVTNFARILSRAQERDFADFLRKLATCDLLVIDDIGSERKTEYASEIVFQVIDDRYKSDKPLIVTTNLAIEDLVKTDNLSLARAYERIISMCSVRVVMQGTSRRRKIMRDKSVRASKILND